MARYALLIGVSEFADDRLARLNAPTNDVIALRGILQDGSRGNFDSVELSLNEDFLAVRDRLSIFFHDRAPDDVLFLYYSGHGILGRGNRLFLATSGSDLDTPRTRSVSAQEIRDFIEESRAQRQVVVLDCCHSGAFAEHAKAAVPPPAVTPNTFSSGDAGLYVLTAADTLQFAWDGAELRTGNEAVGGFSQFTSWLVEGLEKGEAAPDDEQITMDALYRYLFGRARSKGSAATPQRFVQGGVGDLVVSRNPLAGSSRIDPETMAALAAENWRMRLGAVTELAQQMREGKTTAARAARLALQRHLDHPQHPERDFRVRDAIAATLTEDERRRAETPRDEAEERVRPGRAESARTNTEKERRRAEEERRVGDEKRPSEAAAEKPRVRHAAMPSFDKLSFLPSGRTPIVLSKVGVGLALLPVVLVPTQYNSERFFTLLGIVLWASVMFATFVALRFERVWAAFLLAGLNLLLFAVAIIFLSADIREPEPVMFVLFALAAAIESAVAALHVWTHRSPNRSLLDGLIPDPSRRTPVALSIVGTLPIIFVLLLVPSQYYDQTFWLFITLVWASVASATFFAVRSEREWPAHLLGVLNPILLVLAILALVMGQNPGFYVLFAIAAAIESGAAALHVWSRRSLDRRQPDERSA